MLQVNEKVCVFFRIIKEKHTTNREVHLTGVYYLNNYKMREEEEKLSSAFIYCRL